MLTSLIVLAAMATSPPTRELNITVNPANITTRVTPFMYGSGIESYENQMYGGIWSNMLYDSSFEDTAPFSPQQRGSYGGRSTAQSWYLAPSSAPGACAVANTQAFNGNKSLRLDAGCTLRNRGLVATQGASSMHFVGAKSYEGYIFATSPSGSTIRISALCTAIGDFTSEGRVLGTVDVDVQASSDWNQYNFTFNASASCLQGSSARTTPSANGQGLVQVALMPGSASPTLLDELMFEPGEWGRYKGMHVRKDLADVFLDQRPTIMRLGGSMTNSIGFRWRYMVGPVWSRPPTDSMWLKNTLWGFGIFEFLQFAESAGIEPVRWCW